MQCPHCSTDVPDSAAFCSGCGRRLANAGSTHGPALGQISRSARQHGQGIAKSQRADSRVGDVAERELWRGSYSYKAMTGTLIAVGLLTIVGFVGLMKFGDKLWFRYIDLACIMLLWLAVAITMLRRRLGIRYRLTNQRFFIEKGVLHRVTERIEVIDIDDLQFEQNLVERLFDVGSITLTSTDRSVPKFWLQGVEHVKEVSDLIDQARRAERNRRGLYIESS